MAKARDDGMNAVEIMESQEDSSKESAVLRGVRTLFISA
jgi:hypothetical protein